MPRYSTALSHLVLAGTGIYCLKAYGVKEPKCAVASFGLVVVNSALGVWRYGNPDYGDRVEKPFSYTTVLQTLFVLPCIATEIWLNNGYEWQWSYIHVAASLIPLSAYLGGKDWKDISQALLVANTVSLGVVSYLAEKYFGVAAAVSFGIDYILISEEGYSISDKIPSQDLFNYGMCFAAYFSLRALCE